MKKTLSFLPSYLLTVYALLVLTTSLFLFCVPEWSVPAALVVLPSLFFYPMLETIPAALLGFGVGALTAKFPRGRLPVGAVLWLWVFPTHLFLLLDAGLYARYGYHVNPHVLNIFTTPGGFEGMGLRRGEILLMAAGLAFFAVFHALLIWIFIRFPKLCPIRRTPWWSVLAAAVFGTVCFFVSFLTYAYNHYTMNPLPLQAADAIPFYLRGTAVDFFERIGVPRPERDAVMVRLGSQGRLDNYPERPVRRGPHPAYNVVWLACESWAARLFTPEIMPETHRFARHGIVFRKHYSGGNVTRQGLFSMFYGLPGSYWHAFLAVRRGPLFIDWLLEDGYRMQCITSSKFTYPEFDQTVFCRVPQDRLHSDSDGRTFARDQRNVRLLLKSIREGADSGNPFFSFMFFESPHHPYEFPPEATLFSDYIEPFNAVRTQVSDGPAIFRRAANAARHLDMRLAEVFRLLEERDLLRNTIVVLTGDHGEEYYEKGRLGHSSAFNEEQTRTTLILYYPGIRPGEYVRMSSHLDIVPMIARFFGVENDPADYSCGLDLLKPGAAGRRYALVANWSQVFFAGEKYKSMIPLNAADMAAQVITDADDRKLPDVKPFYREYNADLIQVQRDLTRFTGRGRRAGR